MNDKKIDVLPLKNQFANTSLNEEQMVYPTDDTAQNDKNITNCDTAMNVEKHMQAEN